VCSSDNLYICETFDDKKSHHHAITALLTAQVKEPLNTMKTMEVPYLVFPNPTKAGFALANLAAAVTVSSASEVTTL